MFYFRTNHEIIETVTGIILNASILYLLTILYLQFYKATRKENRFSIKTLLKIKSPLIICFCLFLSVIGYNFDYPSKYLLPLLGIIAGTDIFFHRIPTEFLILLAIICIRANAQSMLLLRLTYMAVVFIFWYAFRKKLDMGLYDILLISILSLNFSSISSVLLFSSAFLIIWGCIGILLQKIFKIKPNTKIPLAPLIFIAFIALMIR